MLDSENHLNISLFRLIPTLTSSAQKPLPDVQHYKHSERHLFTQVN